MKPSVVHEDLQQPMTIAVCAGLLVGVVWMAAALFLLDRGNLAAPPERTGITDISATLFKRD